MKNIVTWLVEHPTIVNLMLVGMLIASFISIDSMPKESFPETALDLIVIQNIYRGAGPKEIEKGILLKIEDAVQGIAGVDLIRAEAKENVGMVQVELTRGANVQQVLQDVKDKLEQINTFPKDADKPIAYIITRKKPVMDLALRIKGGRSKLQTLAEKIKDGLLSQSKITQVSLQGALDREISIEINEVNLRKYNLQIADVTRALKTANLDISGGTLKSKKEDLLIRIYNKRTLAKDLEKIVVRNLPGGHIIRIKDIAKAKETFTEDAKTFFFNGESAVIIRIESVKGDNVLKIAKQAKNYIKKYQSKLSKSTKLEIYRDYTIELKDRISLLVRNGFQGLILVLLTLSFFMNLRLAFWVASGLVISFLGALIVGYLTGISINMMSLFGLLLVIGILVDDGIVISENVYSYIEKGMSPKEAAIKGSLEVMPAVLMSVLTTCFTFLPLFFMGGMAGKFIFMIPAMVVAALSVSLIESFLVLPPHLAHSLKPRTSLDYTQGKIRHLIDKFIDIIRDKLYGKTLMLALKNRWIVISFAIGLFFLAIGTLRGGIVKFVFFPKIDGDRVAVRFTMKPGTPRKETKKFALQLERAALKMNRQLKKQYGRNIVIARMHWIGRQTAVSMGFSTAVGDEVGEVQLELLPGEQRPISGQIILNKWRKILKLPVNISQISFAALGTPPLGRALEFQLLSDNQKELKKAVQFLKTRLSLFNGVYNPEDDLDQGKRELRMKLTPLAQSLGIPLQVIALQVRYRLYGQEAMRLQRGRDDIRVVIKTPSNKRSGFNRLKNMWISIPKGKRIPLSQLVKWESAKALKVIRRINRQRMATVGAQLDEAVANRKDIISVLKKSDFIKIKQIAPSVHIVLAGQGREQTKVMGGMKKLLPISLFAIFFLLMLIFSSYTQVLIVLAMIPFGIIGAIIGHYIMGIPLTILSIFGIVGVSGVVINDSILLIDTINRRRKTGEGHFDVVFNSAKSRLRAILSTTLTTFFGLTPLLLERSRQAQFLIPMALALASGVLFTTFLTLILIPSLVLALEDIKDLIAKKRKDNDVETSDS